MRLFGYWYVTTQVEIDARSNLGHLSFTAVEGVGAERDSDSAFRSVISAQLVASDSLPLTDSNSSRTPSVCVGQTQIAVAKSLTAQFDVNLWQAEGTVASERSVRINHLGIGDSFTTFDGVVVSLLGVATHGDQTYVDLMLTGFVEGDAVTKTED